MITRKITELKFHSFLKLLKFPSFCISCERFLNKNTVTKTSRADFRMSPNVFRQKKVYDATVQDVFSASSSTKILRLLVKEDGFSFKAGQWVDFYVPGIAEVTGYSMTSPPNEAKENGILELSIKYGTFPPTYWVHTKCSGGEEVQIRVGGDFYYDPFCNQTEAEANLLLVGGGVGINPLVSILYEYSDMLMANTITNPGKVHLLYSAKTEEELIFKESFTNMEKEHPSLLCRYFVTGQLETKQSPDSRITKDDVIQSIRKLQAEKTLCYVCGPSNMTDEVASWLHELGIDKEHIRYEKWW
ncbi:oxidoreductase NAD-binding domain-containing protein 1-like isoform X2 [Uloborus diversus]|uniref:oxidoreductase NAD-binding domain-containing protein 1-like isoform X2 n=1 Tax=Uloborus diversus TaxID=327109 RepID=UPI00240A562F|nr:oxidoreductase NAD-binding domain-containing protein 1-like isoform X2 [Uloborus diversus]